MTENVMNDKEIGERDEGYMYDRGNIRKGSLINEHDQENVITKKNKHRKQKK